MNDPYMRPPYPYFGGKMAVAGLVWSRLGDPDNYIEPFFGGGAVAIARPHSPRIECYGDWNAFVSGFWRAIQVAPEEVAYWAGAPVSECELHAAHRWLMGVAEPEPLVPARYDRHPLLRDAYLAGYARQDGSYGRAYRRRMRTDPDYYDPKISGRWAYGSCAWIGSGWCEEDPAEVEALEAGQDIEVTGSSEWEQMTHLHKAGADGQGIHVGPQKKLAEKRPHLGAAENEYGHRTHHGVGVHRKLPEGQRPDLRGNSDAAGAGIHASGAMAKAKPSAEWEQMPQLGQGSHPGKQPGKGVHAEAPQEKRPQLHTGNSEHGRGVHGEAKASSEWEQKPYLASGSGASSRGVHGMTSCRPQLADTYSRGRGVHGNNDAGTCEQRNEWLCRWFRTLADRFRTSRFCCGDWTETIEAWRRICNSPSTTTRLGTVGMLLDPPYRQKRSDGSPSRAAGLYGRADRHAILGKLNDDVLIYCLEHGPDPLFRIVVCGFEGDGYEKLVEHGWEEIAWKGRGGYGNRTKQGQENRSRERLWCSPHCLKPDEDRPKQKELFGDE